MMRHAVLARLFSCIVLDMELGEEWADQNPTTTTFYEMHEGIGFSFDISGSLCWVAMVVGTSL